MQKQNITDIPISYILDENFENIDENKEYTTDDLQVGMKVHSRQINGVHDIWVLLANPIGVILEDDTYANVGTIVYIGKRNEEFEKAYNKYTIGNKRPMIIFNEHDDMSAEWLQEPLSTVGGN